MTPDQYADKLIKKLGKELAIWHINELKKVDSLCRDYYNEVINIIKNK